MEERLKRQLRTEWGKKADISSSTIARVKETGAVSPAILADLYRSVGQDPLAALVEYGFIRESDIRSQNILEPDQREVLLAYEGLQGDEARQAFRAGLQGYAQSVQGMMERGLLQSPPAGQHRQ